MFRTRFVELCCFVWLASVAGCNPVFQHPLSDRATSQLDERLIGIWNLEKVGGMPENGPPVQIVVGRTSDNSELLEAVTTELDEKQTVTITRIPVLTNKIGQWGYISVQDADDPKKRHSILRYRFVDADRLHLFDTKKAAIVRAVESHQLSGKVVRTKVTWLLGLIRTGGNVISTEVTANSEELDSFFRKHGDECFEKNPTAELSAHRSKPAD